MKNVTIDCFGNRNDLHPGRFNSLAGKKRPYIVDEAGGGVTYVCFDNKPKRTIQRSVEVNGVTTITWAFGSWDARATLNYTATLNEPLTVEMED